MMISTSQVGCQSLPSFLSRTCFRGGRRVSNFSSTTRIKSDNKIALVRGTIPEMGRGLEIGQYAEVDRIFTTKEVSEYGRLIQDDNALHSPMVWKDALQKMPHLQANLDAGLIQLEDDNDDDGFIRTKPLVHGMFVSSLFSSIFATISPGCVYMNQTLHFAAPVFVDETITGRIEILKVRKWRRGGVVVQCDTRVIRSGTAVVTGDANVWLPSGYSA